MVEDHANQGNDIEMNLFSSAERDLLQKEVVLSNGVKMPCSSARGNWEILLFMYQQEPDLFNALVAFSRNEPIANDAHAELRRRHDIREDNKIRPALAAVLDAAYCEPQSPDEIPLRYPIVHENPEQVEQIRKIARDMPQRLLRRILRHEKNADGPTR